MDPFSVSQNIKTSSISQSPVILNVAGLRVSYGSLVAARDVSFTVHGGEIFGLLGPNGAGKTSTLTAIEGLIQPDAGTITVAGYNMKEKPLYARANMGVQLQSTSFQPELTVREIFKLFAGLYSVDLS